MAPEMFDTSQVVFRAGPPDRDLWPYNVPVGGWTVAHRDDGMVRQRFHEHVLILSLSGLGCVEVGDATFDVSAGSLVWLDTARAYAHGVEATEDWRYLWLSITGDGLDRLQEQLGFLYAPVLGGCGSLEPTLRTLLAHLGRSETEFDAKISADVAAILAFVASKRAIQMQSGSQDVRRATTAMRNAIERDWRIADLAEIAGISESQLFRRFKQETGSSPMGWLRQERMVLATYLLRSTAQSVAQVAVRCGYSDPFHFSRDFRRSQDCPPRAFRARFRE